MQISDTNILGTNNNVIIANPNSNFFFIPIPKNASSSTYNFLQQFDWCYYQFDNRNELLNKIGFTVLRDPIERWCSGFAQDFYYTYGSSGLNNSNSLYSLLREKNYNFGLHTREQTYYLENINLDTTIFFKHDNTYSSNLEHFTSNTLKFSTYKQVYKSKSIMDNNIKTTIKNIIHLNPKYLTLLKKYLEKDLDLYYSVKFYKG